MQSKSLFDLIDYCELLYERSSELLLSTNAKDHLHGLKTYTKGYLIFNYFINSFIIMHFKGFDAFVETNEQDFIIYLNIFAFYNTHEYFNNGIYSINSDRLRDYIRQYLVDKHLLSFDIDELYNWLGEYIKYLKEKDQLEMSNLSIEDVSSVDKKSIASIGSGPDSINDFKMRYPSLNRTLMDENSNKKPSSPPPVPTELPPMLSETRYAKSEDAVQSHGYKKPPPPPPESQPPPPPPPHDPRFLIDTVKNERLSKSQTNLPYPRMEHLPFPVVEEPPHISNNPFYNRSRAETPESGHIRPKLQPHLDGYFNNGNVQNGNGLRHPHALHSPQSYQSNMRYDHNSHPFAYSTSPSHNGARIAHGNTQPHLSEYHYTQHMKIPQQVPPPLPQQQYMIPPYEQLKAYRTNMLKEYAVCGMRNFGSSCYINSTVQLLFGIDLFKTIFSLGYQKYIKEEKYLRILAQPNSHKKDSVLLAEAISGLLRTFQLNGSLSISPTKFIRVNSLIKPDFNIPHEQQDAQEYLLFVLERLHDELSDKRSQTQLEDYIRKWNICINVKDRSEYLKWCQSLIEHEGTSPIHDLFQGHLQNKLTCTKCGYESISYSPFSILSLPIPSTRNAHNVVNLGECLQYYIQDEVLSGENAWHCPKCHGESDPMEGHMLDNHPVFTTKRSGIFKLGGKKNKPSKTSKNSKTNGNGNSKSHSTTISTKSLTFIKLPQILLIHLARFSMYNLTDKLSTLIKFPLTLRFQNGGHEIVYKLCGLINHFGNLKSGHYTALVNKSMENPADSLDNLRNPFWCLFDDENVKSNVPNGSLNPPYDELTSLDVYVLCYERV